MDTPEREGVEEENEEIGRFRTELGYEVVLTSVPRLGDGLLMTMFMMENKEPVKRELYLDKDILSYLAGAFSGHLLSVAFGPLMNMFAEEAERLEEDNDRDGTTDRGDDSGSSSPHG